jgi:hypothetical protein
MPQHLSPVRYDWSRVIVPRSSQANGVGNGNTAGSIAFKLWTLAAHRRHNNQVRVLLGAFNGSGVLGDALSSQDSRKHQGLLDVLYDQLSPLIHTVDSIERLHKCSYCGDSFISRTRRRQNYCTDACWKRANPKLEKNRQSQRKYRDSLIPADLKRVEDVKAKHRDDGEDVLKEEWILETLKMDRRRWNSLVKWEIARYGERRITDLRRPEVWEVVGLPKSGEVVPRGQRSMTATPATCPGAEQPAKPHPHAP